ncbi:MAG TPA: lysophospholipid acyltransferase family protein [Ilumatobacteraceae bacterium]|nr:lysophospholipid acyltransferase family protein [Ilumatobacteraceae bacterium]
MSALQRRAVSIPALLLGAVALVILLPLWLPLAALSDGVRLRWRLPTVRLLAFAVCWAWLETIGVTVALLLWLTGQRRNQRAHFALQRWWAARLMGALQMTTGIRVEAADASSLSPGPAIMLCRHASLADSLLSAWVVTSMARMNPRYVLKKELLADPCLDIVGNRLPNYFLDRQAPDSATELSMLRILAAGLTDDQVAIIFPEGTRSSPTKRARALDKIRERDPARADRLAGMRHLLPPRPAGTQALLGGRPDADVIVAWHVGFDGLDTFGGILRHLARRPRTVQFHARRIARADVPGGASFTRWLDDQWLQSDRAVHDLLHPEGTS